MKNTLQTILLIAATFFITGGIVIIIPAAFEYNIFLGLASLFLLYFPGLVTKKTYDIANKTESKFFMRITKFLVTIALMAGILIATLMLLHIL